MSPECFESLDLFENLMLVIINTTNQKFVEGTADATINLKRGFVVCSTRDDYITNEMFGEKSFHFEDWAMYYQNIKENGQKRIDAYFSK